MTRVRYFVVVETGKVVQIKNRRAEKALRRQYNMLIELADKPPVKDYSYLCGLAGIARLAGRRAVRNLDHPCIIATRIQPGESIV